jgi:uncharacterized protein (DUF1501 family)
MRRPRCNRSFRLVEQRLFGQDRGEIGVRHAALQIGIGDRCAISDFQLFAGDEALAAYRDIMNYERPDSTIADLNRRLRKSAIENGSALRDKTKDYRPQVEYPRDNPLANSLRDIASVIWANLGARGFSVSLGGFDTHKNQNQNNLHAYLLKTFSDAVAVFYNDLRAQNLSQNVLLLTISDFGGGPKRTPTGEPITAMRNCCFVIGDRVRKGMWGVYPCLESSQLVFDQNLDVTVDYRAVFATILARHFDIDPKPIVGVSEMLGFL